MDRDILIKNKNNHIRQNQLEIDYKAIIKGFEKNNPFLYRECKKEGDFFKKMTAFDESIVCVSGILK